MTAGVLLIILVVAGLAFTPPDIVAPVAALVGCVSVVGAAVYYYFGYQRIMRQNAGMRQMEIDDVDSMSGVEFERYVAELFRHEGYVIETTAASGDLGVDLVIARSRERTAVQIKRYSKPVNQAAIREAVAGMKHYRCQRAMVVTNSRFTKLARQLAQVNDCELMDREALQQRVAQWKQG